MTSSKDLQKHSPTLTRLLKTRLAPVREEALLAAAARDAERPIKPAAGDCCGSSCNPCVMDLYREELKIWKECLESRGRSAGEEVEGAAVVSGESGLTSQSEEQTGRRKIPGTFEW
ncbi:hypothetical protein BDV97DRAFT_367423 [Delphinella strobiligena]|nr:hypothetical protein BDV97DRAFT_367423 [Delphinella strobiligena]